MENKKGQYMFGMSFSVIFSIILIIFFIIIAFIVINNFLKSKNCLRIGIFIDNFEKETENAWNLQEYNGEFKSILPSKIKYICFANLSKTFFGKFEKIGDSMMLYENNMFFYPKGKSCDIPSYQIKHLDINEITKNKNPYCIPVNKGNVIIKINKGFNKGLVKIS